MFFSSNVRPPESRIALAMAPGFSECSTFSVHYTETAIMEAKGKDHKQKPFKEVALSKMPLHMCVRDSYPSSTNICRTVRGFGEEVWTPILLSSFAFFFAIFNKLPLMTCRKTKTTYMT